MIRHFFNNNRQTIFHTATALLLLISTTLVGFSATKTKKKDHLQSEYIFPLQEKHVHSSCVTELPNGDLLACWFEGSGERHANDVMIRGARLKKGDKEWSSPFLMADTPGNPDCNPIIFIDQKERLHLVWIVVVANKWETSILKTRISTNYQNEGAPKWDWQDIILLKPGKEFAQTLETKFTELNTPEQAWAEYAPLYERMIVEAAHDPAKRELGWMGRIKPLLFPGNKILMPLYSDGFNVSLVAISDDSGDTWKPSLPIVGRGNIQPTILQKKEGDLVAYMRDNGDSPGRIFESSSSDGGYSWTPAKKTSIPNPGSSVDAVTLSDGTWLMVCNDLENGRNKLSIYVSIQEGEDWQWIYSLEDVPLNEGSFAYPSIIQSKDKLIHISYTYNVNNLKTIKHVSFSISWLNSQVK